MGLTSLADHKALLQKWQQSLHSLSLQKKLLQYHVMGYLSIICKTCSNPYKQNKLQKTWKLKSLISLQDFKDYGQIIAKSLVTYLCELAVSVPWTLKSEAHPTTFMLVDGTWNTQNDKKYTLNQLFTKMVTDIPEYDCSVSLLYLYSTTFQTEDTIISLCFF